MPRGMVPGIQWDQIVGAIRNSRCSRTFCRDVDYSAPRAQALLMQQAEPNQNPAPSDSSVLLRVSPRNCHWWSVSRCHCRPQTQHSRMTLPASIWVKKSPVQQGNWLSAVVRFIDLSFLFSVLNPGESVQERDAHQHQLPHQVRSSPGHYKRLSFMIQLPASP